MSKFVKLCGVLWNIRGDSFDWEAEIICSYFFIFLVLLIIHPSALAEESSGGSVQKRRIAIVLDNSDSMIIDNANLPYLPRWAEATHALRTFLYILESK